MGRMFDTLRRRNNAHAPASEAPASAAAPPGPPGPRVPERETTAAVDAWVDVEMPFVEVGGGATITPHAPPAAECKPSVVANPVETKPAAHFQSEEPTSTRDANPAPALVVWSEPQSRKAEQYRQVSAALLARRQESAFGSLLLAPADAAVCASASANLALAFAEEGRRKVLLADAATRTPTLAGLFQAARAPGWAELLLGLPPAQATQEVGFEALHLITAGNRLASAGPIVCGQRLRALLRHWAKHYDLVLVHAPSCEDVSEVVALALACDAACFLKLSSTSTEEQACARALQREGVRVLGSIVSGE